MARSSSATDSRTTYVSRQLDRLQTYDVCSPWAAMQITHVETYSVPIAGVQPPFAWRHGLRGAPPDGEGAVLRIGTSFGCGRRRARSPTRQRAGSSRDIVDRVLRDELIGPTRLQREWLWHRLWELDRTEELPALHPGARRHRAVGPGRPRRQPADLAAPWRLSPVDPGVRVDGDVRDARGVPRRGHAVPRAWLPAIKLHALG